VATDVPRLVLVQPSANDKGSDQFYHRCMSVPLHHAIAPPVDVRARLERVRRLVDLLDTAFTIPGTNFRFGLDAIVGLIPGAGDLATSAVALYIVIEAQKLGAPGSAIARMIINIAIDFLVGAIPILGDIFDTFWKANVRNLRILERALSRKTVA
jgi:hypothetical protein